MFYCENLMINKRKLPEKYSEHFRKKGNFLETAFTSFYRRCNIILHLFVVLLWCDVLL